MGAWPRRAVPTSLRASPSLSLSTLPHLLAQLTLVPALVAQQGVGHAQRELRRHAAALAHRPHRRPLVDLVRLDPVPLLAQPLFLLAISPPIERARPHRRSREAPAAVGPVASAEGRVGRRRRGRRRRAAAPGRRDGARRHGQEGAVGRGATRCSEHGRGPSAAVRQLSPRREPARAPADEEDLREDGGTCARSRRRTSSALTTSRSRASRGASTASCCA